MLPPPPPPPDETDVPLPLWILPRRSCKSLTAAPSSLIVPYRPGRLFVPLRDAPAIIAAASGLPVKIISSYGGGERMHRIVAGPKSGIEAPATGSSPDPQSEETGGEPVAGPPEASVGEEVVQ